MTGAAPRGTVRVVSLRHYPVKSVAGEELSQLTVDERGVVGDRAWAVRTPAGRLGSGKNTRRFEAVPHLLEVCARRTGDRVIVMLPDGTEHDVESPRLAQALGVVVGRPVALAAETDIDHFDDGPVSLVARASVRAVAEQQGEPVDEARFRPNIVVEGPDPFGEEDWIGRRLRVGTVVLAVEMASERCVMVDQATAELPAQPGNLRTVGRLNGARLGVIARVVRSGVVSVGDEVQISP